MKIRTGVFILLLFILCALNTTSPLFGAALDIDQYNHTEEQLGILVITGNNIASIDELKERPRRVKIAVLQVPEKKLNADSEKVILDFIKDGGTVWFYDSRLAHIFGLENAPLKGEDLRYKPQKGTYGDESKSRGAATYLQSYGTSPILKGVNLVLAFLLEVGKDRFSAIKVTDDVTPLLIANDPKIASAAEKNIGEGKVILKPLIWLEAVDGKRFQTNLLEYSAGYPVPDIKNIVSADKKAELPSKPDEVDRVVLNNGNYYDGKLENDSFRLETMNGSAKLSPDDLSEIRIKSFMNMDEVVTKNNKTQRGMVSWGDELRLKAGNGKKMTFSKMEISKIFFRK
ncbi:MAG: hypothetical protein M1269_11590 [Chloroflexi bacterium]|nr:hypothetical protein [Chloroflexota bacterium]